MSVIARRRFAAISGMTFFLLWLGPQSCNVPKPQPCGEFAFTSAPDPAWPRDKPYPGPGRVRLSFNYKPELCGAAPCTCRRVVFVQAIKFVLPPYVPKQPHPEQAERMTQSENNFFKGWAIDRTEGAIQPYYGMNDDGSFPLDPLLGSEFYSATPGGPGVAAVLRDSPVSSQWDSYNIQAISVPACLDGDSACDHHILGYYSWSWSVPDKNKSNYTNYDYRPAPVEMYVQAFDLAAQEWNKHLDNKRLPLELKPLHRPIPNRALTEPVK